MNTAYLIPAINELKTQCKTEKGHYGDIYYRGQHGTAKIVRDSKNWKVYWFEPNTLKSEESYTFSSKREATFFSLQCAVKGYV
jgi:hypothetical protein